jgi:hypothetical protein
METPANIGSRNVTSKDFIDTDISIFTTQKKRIASYAEQNGIPTKFVFPILQYKTQSPSDVTESYETMPEYIDGRMKEKIPISKIAEEIHEKFPNIKESEVLYWIANMIPVNKKFYEQAEIIDPLYKDPQIFADEKADYEEETIPRLLQADKRELKQMKDYFSSIQTIDPILTSDMKIEKITVEFDIQVPDQDDNLLMMAPDLFANLVTNNDIPFVKYIDQRQNRYKVFNGETFETRPPFKIFKDRFAKFTEKNHIYFVILADQNPNSQEYTKNSYISASIDLEKSVLTYKYLVLVHRNEVEIIDSISKLFPTLGFINRREKNYGATFNIYYDKFRDDSFLDLLLTEPFNKDNNKLFSSLIFVDEFEKPVSEKKKLKMYYDTNISFTQATKRQEDLSKIASLGFYLTQYISGYNDSDVAKGRYNITNFAKSLSSKKKLLGMKNTPTQSILLEKNTPYLVVNISKANNRFVLFQFMNIFARLINLYSQVQESYDEIYDKLIPELKDLNIQQEVSLVQTPKPKSEKETNQKMNLSKIAPDIFTGSYSRNCQYKNQPIIIPEVQIPEWTNKKINLGDKVYDRPVKKIGDYYFVCPSDQYPFVQFKQNLDPDRQYESYPCCYMTPKEEVKERQRASTYRSRDPIKTNRVMAEGGIGTIPTPIEEMIKGGFEKQVSLFRMGSLVCPNSFLACACIALGDKQYYKLKSNEQKEKYLEKIRKEIANDYNLLPLSSELFDVPEIKRKENLLDVETFLDPTLYYRIIEEVFGLNIFVFSGSMPKANVEPSYSLEISRFSSIPIHSFKKGRPTMIIYKHWGSETDHLEYPHCELIVAGLESSDATLFTDDLSLYLLKAYFISAEVFGNIWEPSSKYFGKYNSQLMYKLIASDFVSSFNEGPIQAVGQIIDEKGKLAALQLQSGNTMITMSVPPLCPQDLPLVSEIYKPRISTVVKLFVDKPTGYTVIDNKVVAVWFKISTLEHGIQVPIEPVDLEKTIDKYGKLSLVPENRLRLEEEKPVSEIARLMKLQKDVNIIVQLVRLLFLVYNQKFNDSPIETKLEKARKFIEEKIKINPRREDKDSAVVYDFSQLERKLPKNKSSYALLIKDLEKQAPSFTDGKQILISGKKFFERITESLEYYVRLNLPIQIPDYLEGFYESVYDYPKIPKNLLFLSQIDFERWLKQAIENPTSSYPVVFSLKQKYSEMNGPYLYAVETTNPTIQNPFGQNFAFIIQNAPYIRGKESALQNAILWKENKINRPEVSRRELSEFNNYKIFTIGQNEKFELLEDKSTPSKKIDTVFILKYSGVDRYASVLPM